MCAKKSIKSLKPRSGKRSRFKQGYFNVSESLKYVSKHEPCIYRSSYEYKFMQWCERSVVVRTWDSESISVKYTCPLTGKQRNYWLDFTLTTHKDEKWLIEVKPHKEVNDVKRFSRRMSNASSDAERKRLCQAHKTAAMNWSKWNAAKEYCNRHGFRFVIVTEKFLKM